MLVAALSCWAASPVAAAPGPVAAAFQWSPFLAPFHSVLLHYPIGFVTLAVIFEIWYWRKPSPELRRIIGFVVLLSVLSTAVVVSLGICRAAGGGYDDKALESHRASGLITGVLLLTTFAAQRLAHRQGARLRFQAGYRFLLLGTLAAMVIAGHRGGNLTHGSKYLVKNAPDFVKTLFDETEAPSTNTVVAGTGADRLFADKIQPIFEAKCVKCHGPEKQKSRYRLDTEALALKPGESGEATIKFGDPMQSHLARLILLPKDHDQVMPPEGREPLTPDEILTIVHWVQTGKPPAPEIPAVAPELSAKK